jgi:hypothetical protein
MLIRPAIGDTDPIRYRRHTPDGQFSGNIIDEAMRPWAGGSRPIFERRLTFRHEAPFDRSSLTRWRQRPGEEQIAALLW